MKPEPHERRTRAFPGRTSYGQAQYLTSTDSALWRRSALSGTRLE